MAQLKSALYERAVKMFATSDAEAVLRHCLATFQEMTKEARHRQEIIDAQARSEQLRQCHSMQYEQTLKAWASSDVRSLLHYVFSSWHDVLREVARRRESAAALRNAAL